MSGATAIRKRIGQRARDVNRFTRISKNELAIAEAVKMQAATIDGLKRDMEVLLEMLGARLNLPWYRRLFVKPLTYETFFAARTKRSEELKAAILIEFLSRKMHGECFKQPELGWYRMLFRAPVVQEAPVHFDDEEDDTIEDEEGDQA